ncbi:CHC2 zinc finger domain-containing protein [Hydrocarboniphaga effusa]|uniref:CHC2 zinc finger domain-containing protein n=1 Tax=Hydrocarboniphaga effusa TaxID=243629 RepID=UPI00398C0FA5
MNYYDELIETAFKALRELGQLPTERQGEFTSVALRVKELRRKEVVSHLNELDRQRAALIADKEPPMNIVEAVRPHVHLSPSGRLLRGLSPFAKEATPSFFVDEDAGTFHCFASGKSGDAQQFIEAIRAAA